MDELFEHNPWLILAAFLGAPPLLFFAELAILAMVP
jgi:hypothetical protein